MYFKIACKSKRERVEERERKQIKDFFTTVIFQLNPFTMIGCCLRMASLMVTDPVKMDEVGQASK